MHFNAVSHPFAIVADVRLDFDDGADISVLAFKIAINPSFENLFLFWAPDNDRATMRIATAFDHWKKDDQGVDVGDDC